MNFRTGQTRLVQAEPLATDWYLSLIDRIRKGERLHTPMFADIAEKFIAYAERVKEVSEGQRRNYRHKWSRLHPFFRNVRVTDIDAAWLNQFGTLAWMKHTSGGRR